MNNIEDTMCEDSLPGNTIAMAIRLIEILKENSCNHIPSIKNKEDQKSFLKFKKCLWLINSQVYGQMAIINMMDEWDTLCRGE